MEPFLGEVRCFAVNYAPNGWLPCDGKELSTISYSGLFALLGTTFGGNGTTTFNLPKIQQSVVVGAGQGPGLAMYAPGDTGGEKAVTLGTQHLPAHAHSLPTSTVGVASVPSATSYLAPAPGAGRHTGEELYAEPDVQATTAVTMAAAMAANSRGGQAHDNMAPYLVMNYYIATQGIVPVPAAAA